MEFKCGAPLLSPPLLSPPPNGRGPGPVHLPPGFHVESSLQRKSKHFRVSYGTRNAFVAFPLLHALSRSLKCSPREQGPQGSARHRLGLLVSSRGEGADIPYGIQSKVAWWLWWCAFQASNPWAPLNDVQGQGDVDGAFPHSCQPGTASLRPTAAQPGFHSQWHPPP